MAKLGFFGLGIMGYPMARNLLKPVMRWHCGRTPPPRRRTGRKEGSLRDAGRGRQDTECIFLCVGDSEMSEEVILGDERRHRREQKRAGGRRCEYRIPFSSRKIGEKLAKKGIHFLDAPCTGSKPGAEGGTLTFMIGGDRRSSRR